MRYLCLIYLDEKELEAMPASDMGALNAAHLDFNDGLRASGHFIVAEALEPARATARVRVRHGKRSVTDGPFAETKEMVAGFYLIEARDMDEAQGINAQCSMLNAQCSMPNAQCSMPDPHYTESEC